METKDERYFLGDDIAIEVIDTPNQENFPMKGFGVIFMSGEEKTECAKHGSDEEYSHKIYGHIEFKNKENLKLFQMGAELMQMEIINEDEEEHAKIMKFMKSDDGQQGESRKDSKSAEE